MATFSAVDFAKHIHVKPATLQALIEHFNHQHKTAYTVAFSWNENWQSWAREKLGIEYEEPNYEEDHTTEMRRRVHFPLATLAFGRSPCERLNAILSWCRLKVGRTQLEDHDVTVTAVPSEMGVSVDDWRAFHLGGKLLDIVGSTPFTDLAQYNQLAEFLRPRPKATVDLPIDHLWRTLHCLDGGAKPHMTYTQFSVLCALRSKVGSKPACTCTVPEIQRRALGYLTQCELQEELSERQDGVHSVLSRQNIRTALNTLEKWRIVKRFTPFLKTGAMPSWFWFIPGYGKKDIALMAAAQLKNRKSGRKVGKQQRKEDRLLSLDILDQSPPQFGRKS